MVDIKIKGRHIEATTDKPEEFKEILNDQNNYYNCKGKNHKIIYSPIKDFFVKNVLDDKLKYTIDDFIEDIIDNEVCYYNAKHFFIDIVLDKKIKKYTLDNFVKDFIGDKPYQYNSKQFSDDIISDNKVKFSLENLLNHTIEDKDPAGLYYSILNSFSPYDKFEEEKGKIKKTYKQFMADLLADHFFNKGKINLKEKTEALEKFEKELNYNHTMKFDNDQLKELNNYMKDNYGNHDEKKTYLSNNHKKEKSHPDKQDVQCYSNNLGLVNYL